MDFETLIKNKFLTEINQQILKSQIGTPFIIDSGTDICPYFNLPSSLYKMLLSNIDGSKTLLVVIYENKMYMYNESIAYNDK